MADSSHHFLHAVSLNITLIADTKLVPGSLNCSAFLLFYILRFLIITILPPKCGDLQPV